MFLCWMQVKLGCQEWSLVCAGVHALHVDALALSLLRQDTCRTTGVTNGLCNVLVRMLLV
jgi:hypothetical protein